MASTGDHTTQPGDPRAVGPAHVPFPVPAADVAQQVVGHAQNHFHGEKMPPDDEGMIGTSDEGLDRDKEVNELARKLTSSSSRLAYPHDQEKNITRVSSHQSGEFQNPFLGVEKGSHLDPEGPNFSARAWVTNLIGLRSRDPERYPERTAGFSFKNLSVHGFGTPTDYQKDFLNILLEVGAVFRLFSGSGKQKIQILNNFDGLVENGEMLVVLGRPGSGCSTLLRTIAGETHSLHVDEKSEINYQGISAKQMHNQFRGEAIYMAETDVHFPQLTVGQTLGFAAKARAPRDNFYPGVTRDMYAHHMRDVIMATFGISHTINTNVGNDFVRGVSGGERKRVSIAEAALSQSPLQCWDNSTRGLDSANAIEFCKTLKLSTSLAGATACVAIYQSPQSAYDLFDKVTVLYEGRQIYFGPIHEAKRFFLEMGFDCAARQTTPDFLTSLTSPAERLIKPGYEDRVPRTPDDFVQAWKSSSQYAQLLQDIDAYNQKHSVGGKSLDAFIKSRRAQQAKQQRVKSPYTLSVSQQIMLCAERGFQRLQRDASLTLTQLIGNFMMALVVASVFYNLPFGTSSFFERGSLLFFAVLLNAFASALEILTLYAQRPIVEKHTRYALYHPFSEALASMLCDMPYKITNAMTFNLIIYFMSNLRRTPSAFFIFLLFSFVTTLCMSMMFRTVAAFSRTLAQALTPAALLILALIVYTGFVVPPTGMVPWFRWINYLNPIAYSFESLMVNEFSGRTYPCSSYVPEGGPYNNVPPTSHICSVVGAVAGSSNVSGDAYIAKSFDYHHDHLWRNLGIVLAITLFLMGTYIIGSEYISEAKSKGEVLLFRRGHFPQKAKTEDVEHARAGKEEIGTNLEREVSAVIQKQTAVFQWQDICYDIKIKSETRRILDHVDGWVKPGTLTALMGPSGAGKTTLLDVLATRATIGVISGHALIDGRQRDASFQRKTGYVQQQDLHLSTSTVRESLVFSALMRQPARYSKKEKVGYVDEVIKLLDMEAYADAVVGVPGEGLNVEQRKRLTIGVELAARPELLLFLDEPTSGLDSQTSWSILDFLEKLTAHGQAILCTIHQPSAVLFQRFDRLLFLAPGGKSVYFGEIGERSSTLTSYFERNGATPCPPEENPAEWMMETIGCAPGSYSEIDWPAVWNESPERTEIRRTLEEMQHTLRRTDSVVQSDNKHDYAVFAAPFQVQLWQCLKRVNQQLWRTPAYIWSKIALTTLSALFLGFTFWKSPISEQGLQNQMFSIFMLMIMFGSVLQQMLPYFVIQRALYEARERPAKVYSWQVFMAANILSEIPWQTLVAVLMWACWYWPIGFYHNAQQTGTVSERSGLMLLFLWCYMVFTSTFGHMIIAGIEVAETAANMGNLLFSLTLIFCGVLASPTALPGFWIFMYRVSPFTYLIGGVLATGLANAEVKCSAAEILHFEPYPAGTNCGDYMQNYINALGGYVTNPDATSNCGFCTIGDTNTFLAGISSYYHQRWRNLGIMWVYVVVNIGLAILFYYLARVPKKSRKAKKEEAELAAQMKLSDEEYKNEKHSGSDE